MDAGLHDPRVHKIPHDSSMLSRLQVIVTMNQLKAVTGDETLSSTNSVFLLGVLGSCFAVEVVIL